MSGKRVPEVRVHKKLTTKTQLFLHFLHPFFIHTIFPPPSYCYRHPSSSSSSTSSLLIIVFLHFLYFLFHFSSYSLVRFSVMQFLFHLLTAIKPHLPLPPSPFCSILSLSTFPPLLPHPFSFLQFLLYFLTSTTPSSPPPPSLPLSSSCYLSLLYFLLLYIVLSSSSPS